MAQGPPHSCLRLLVPRLLVLALLLGCGGDSDNEGEPAPEAEAGNRETEAGREAGSASKSSTSFPDPSGTDPRILIRKTHLRVTPSSVLGISELLGQVQRLQETPAYFDEPSSFAIRIERAVTTMTGPSLAALMNEHVFAYQGAPLSDLTIEIREGLLHQQGTLEKAISVPFSMTARVETTEGGKLRLVPETMKAGGLPVENLMDLFGIELADVLDTEKARGVYIVEDDLILDPETLLPPPALRGRVESVSVEGDLLHLTLVRSDGEAISEDGLQPSDPHAARFLFFRGGEVRFGKLTMHDTDLQLVDSDPDDPFDFYLNELPTQLVAGSSHVMPDAGLLVKLPDYGDIEK